MSVEIKYKGNTIASASTDTTKTLKTSGKYCEADIEVINTPDGGGAPVINPLSVTENGTYNAPSGVDGYAPVTVNVPQGVFPTGNINITDTNVTDVTDYATAQVVDTDLVPGNIKKDVNILGVVGSFEGGGGGGDIVTPWYTVKTAEVTIGANSVSNSQTAVAYFEGIFGEKNIIAVYLKDQKASYGADELMSFAPNFLSTQSASISTITAYRMRNNQINSMSTSSGYSCYLYEGAKYAVMYYENKP